MKHKIAHLLGWNHGVVESFYIGDLLWVGFRCTVCNKIEAYPNDKQIQAEEVMKRHNYYKEF